MLSPVRHAFHSTRLCFPRAVASYPRRFSDSVKPTRDIYPFDRFDVRGKVIVTTGGGRGLGFDMAHQLSEAGAKVYVLDILEKPDVEFLAAQKRPSPLDGSLEYIKADVTDVEKIDDTISTIADRHKRLDGLIAAAGIQKVGPAIGQPQQAVEQIMRTNFFGAFNCATACGRQMLEKKCQGSIALVASMSGLVANKGMYSSVYNSSKAAVIQLAKNLAQEWGPTAEDGSGGIRVNSLCPGHTYTPMVRMTFQDAPGAKETWESANMLHKIARPSEFRGVALFLMSDASSFMTGNALIVDGGHTAW